MNFFKHGVGYKTTSNVKMVKHKEVINIMSENIERHYTFSLELYCFDWGQEH